MEIKSTEIKLIDISEIKENEHNRNTHPEDQIARLADIIKAEGFRVPLIVSNRSGLLVAGHGRLLAARMLGLTKLPVSFQDFDSEEQEYRVGISDNAVAEWSEIDMSQIHKDLENLQPFDLTLLGFRDFTFEPDPVVGLTDEDSVPEDVVSKVKLGDLFILGNHRLLCGDSTNIQHVERLMNGEKADMVFTDPPYGIDLDDSKNKNSYPKGMKANKFGKIIGDSEPFKFLDSYAMVESIQEQFWWGANYYCQELPRNGSFIVWSKKTTAQRDVKALFNSDFELCWTKTKHRQKLFEVVWTGAVNKESGEDRLHPTQKPIAIIEKIFSEIVGKLTSVIDIFGGSGSTLIACEKTNRKCFMMELDPHYCSVIIERWKQFTGKEAFLLNEDHTQTPWSEITTRT